MNDHEKSVMLVRAMGWKARSLNDDEGNIGYFDHNGNDMLPQNRQLTYLDVVLAPDFYLPVNMALAWRVLNWASMRGEFQSDDHFAAIWGHWFIDWAKQAEAQRAWLDKILSLAIEAGIVEVTDG